MLQIQKNFIVFSNHLLKIKSLSVSTKQRRTMPTIKFLFHDNEHIGLKTGQSQESMQTIQVISYKIKHTSYYQPCIPQVPTEVRSTKACTSHSACNSTSVGMLFCSTLLQSDSHHHQELKQEQCV